MAKEKTNPLFSTLSEIGHFRITSRSLEDYQQIFTVNLSECKQNARILDIGSGLHQELASNLAKIRPDIVVVSVDPSLALPDKENELKERGLIYEIQERGQKVRQPTLQEREERRKNKFGQVVAMIAPYLHFQDNSFDYIFDNHSAFMYFPDQPQIQREYIKTILRILKPDGHAYIYPLDPYEEALALANPYQKLETSKQRILTIVQDLKINHYEPFEFTERPEEVFNLPRLGVKITKP